MRGEALLFSPNFSADHEILTEMIDACDYIFACHIYFPSG